jgi:uncharacterized heparinase superfamily protein
VRLASAARLWRTVRHLRREQLVGRVWFRLHRPRPDTRPAPPLRARTGRWVKPARREPSLLGDGRLRFLGEAHALAAGPAAWDDPARERLWRYNLHYFDDLNALHAETRRDAQAALLVRWIAENPPGHGTGWEPYPASLRIANWIKAFLGGMPAPQAWLDSLAAQVRWLGGRIEWHLLGNHLFVNAKALVLAGLFFDGPEADAWRARGLAILRREMPEQLLADGGQFERSPMYHALALEDLLDLLNVAGAVACGEALIADIGPDCRRGAAAAWRWLRCMSHPDGALASFNDSADGIAPASAELERCATALGVAAPPLLGAFEHLPASGYVRLQRGRATLIADVAPLGPDYLMGHAHADTLSFELSLGERRLLVNGGTSRYGLGEQRLRERGTASHNTVQLAGRDSSEVWSGFRVGRRARPFDLQVGAESIACSHDGYRFLPGRPLHRRQWALQRGRLEVEDRVSAPGVPGVARFRIAPGLRLQAEHDGAWRVVEGTHTLARVELLAGDGHVAASSHAPRFGTVLPTETLEVKLREGHAHTIWTWDD